jgi:3-phenylpropionate/trans-cinnamate dioxygenase ferredoxin reductase component
MSTAADRVCIVGAGHAGGELALALRQQGYSGSIVLIGDEVHPPYQRPPLSKAYLKLECEAPALCLRQAISYERANVALELGACVERIDRQARAVHLADGRTFEYSQLAITTGSRARRLGLAAAAAAEQATNFHYFRTIDDVQRLRHRLVNGARVVIVGGGYIGLEVAAAAVSRGAQVTILEALPRVLARVTAPELSSFFEQVHREAGVDVRTGANLTGFEFSAAADAIVGVRCADGTLLPADTIVVGVGIVANTELAAAAGLAVNEGIVVDEYARTTDPWIVAAGDCTNHPNALAGRRVRLESVANAVEQARVAAATLAGKPRAYDAVPWFWSEQYDLKLQIAGLSQGYDTVVLRGAMSARAFVLFYLREGVLIAADCVNRPQDFIVSKRLLGARARIEPAALADESMPLKTFAA